MMDIKKRLDKKSKMLELGYRNTNIEEIRDYIKECLNIKQTETLLNKLQSEVLSNVLLL